MSPTDMISAIQTFAEANLLDSRKILIIGVILLLGKAFSSTFELIKNKMDNQCKIELKKIEAESKVKQLKIKLWLEAIKRGEHREVPEKESKRKSKSTREYL